MECDFYHDLQEQSIYTAGELQMQYIWACQLKDFHIEQTQLIDMHVNNHLKGDLFVCKNLMNTSMWLAGEKRKAGQAEQQWNTYKDTWWKEDRQEVDRWTWKEVKRGKERPMRQVEDKWRENGGNKSSPFIGFVIHLMKSAFCPVVEMLTDQCQRICTVCVKSLDTPYWM